MMVLFYVARGGYTAKTCSRQAAGYLNKERLPETPYRVSGSLLCGGLPP
ncbi:MULTISPECIES: hypothetical protein [unclassified Eikenella]|nr:MULTISPECIES: hypothetical protein [unclassified Eikenella]